MRRQRTAPHPLECDYCGHALAGEYIEVEKRQVHFAKPVRRISIKRYHLGHMPVGA